MALLFSCSIFAQDATNIEVQTTSEKLIVTYDLVGSSTAVYDVVLEFQKENFEIITPKSVNGDIGKVKAGEDKVIVWDVYKDVDGLSGNLNPKIKVSEVLPDPKKVKPQPTPTPPSPKSKSPIVDVLMDKIGSGSKKRNKTYRVGYKIALGSSRVDATLASEAYKRKFSWEVGPVFRWNIHRRVFLQPEVLYHLQHYDRVISANENARTRNHYLRGQLVAGISPFGLGLHFNAGLYYGQLLGGTTQTSLITGVSEMSIDDYPEMNGEDAPVNRGDFGYLIGGSLNIAKGAFALGVYFSQGFDDFTNEAYFGGDPTVLERLTNRSTHFFISRAF